MNGAVYFYEHVMSGYIIPKSGSVYLYEYVLNVPRGKNGSIYLYESIMPNNNPGKIRVWDGTQWVRRPDYIWNGSTWTQIT